MEMRKTGFAEPVKVDARGGVHVLSRERINTIFNRGKATAFKLMSTESYRGGYRFFNDFDFRRLIGEHPSPDFLKFAFVNIYPLRRYRYHHEVNHDQDPF